MIFERIERELAEGEPWAVPALPSSSWNQDFQDCWEVRDANSRAQERPFRLLNKNYIATISMLGRKPVVRKACPEN